MKVFLTGYKGYIGTHLVDLLKKEGYFVTGCDLGIFDGCEFSEYTKPDIELNKDIRYITEQDLENADAVIHLAAISNDPMGEFAEKLTYDINLNGSINLAKKAKKAGVRRFLFAGSCSVYGKGEEPDLKENSQLNPLSAYAISKVEAEKYISELADSNFSPSFLRNSTAYGYSPMLRIDLVVNNLLSCAYTTGDIRIMSDGTPWRPLIHCKDIGRAFTAFLKAPIEKVHNKSVNIGGNTENYMVKEIADFVKRFVPNTKIVYTGETGEDPRNYKVNFDLLKETLPDFRLEYTLQKGIEELYKKMKEHKFTLQDFNGDKYVRLRTLRKRLDKIKI